MKSMTRIILAAFAATALIPVSALAADSKNQGYLVDSNGNIVTSSTTGLCWHDSDWTPARAVEGCDPTDKPVAAAPKAVVIAAAPAAPMAKPAAAAPMPQNTRFSADPLFAFDKSVLKPAGRTMLDDLVRQVEGVSYDVILVTGHADRIGSSAYNQKLSLHRANAVKEYLASKGIPAARIEATGKGETQPVTQAGDCKGAKSAKVIACLQPDRRVDVEMKGTRSN